MKEPKTDQEPQGTAATVSPLPANWVLTTVDAVGSVRLGRQRSPDKHSGLHSTPYIRAANITTRGLDVTDVLNMDFTPAERRLFELEDGDIVLAEASGSASQVGRSAIWRNELPHCCYQNTVIRFRSHAVTPDFALLVFRHFNLAGIFARAARGVGIQHLGASRFSALPFPLAPRAEQLRIAAEVSSRMADLKSAQASLESALQRIDEQEREILAAAVAGTLVDNNELAQESDRTTGAVGFKTQVGLFERMHSDSAARNLPDLPGGWRWRNIAEMGEVRLGKQLSPSEERGPQQRPYLRVANVFEDEIDVSDVKSMHFSDEEHAVYRLQSGDILLNEGQSPELVGRAALYHGEIRDVCFQNTLIRFRAGEQIDAEYALIVFRHYLHSGEFKKIARWSTNIAHLGLQRLASMAIPVPPLRVQRRIVSEARDRLAASRSQATAVRSSLDRVPAMERQLLEAAVTGTLVPQDPADEPASSLLERLGCPPAQTPSTDNHKKPVRGGAKLTTRPRKSKSDDQPKLPLESVLRDAGRALSVPDLFSLAGYDRDSTAEVEQFYIALRDSVGRTLRPTSDGENAILEALSNASP